MRIGLEFVNVELRLELLLLGCVAARIGCWQRGMNMSTTMELSHRNLEVMRRDSVPKQMDVSNTYLLS